MCRVPIKVGDKTYYMDYDTWKKEKEWRKQRENEIHKNIVEYFNKVHHEADKIRRLSNKGSR